MVSPRYLALRPGESKTVEVKINSSTGFEPTIHFSTSNQSGVKPIFKPEKLHIPSYGMATIPLEIKISKYTAPHPQSIFIFANAFFLRDILITDNQSSEDSYFFPKTSKNITKVSNFVVEILPKLTDQEKFAELWNIYGSPMTFVYGILAGIAPVIYNTVRKKLKKLRLRNSLLFNKM